MSVTRHSHSKKKRIEFTASISPALCFMRSQAGFVLNWSLFHHASCCLRSLHRLQAYRLRGRLPGGLLPEGPNFVIDPDECIDCAVCIPECPEAAIYAEEDVPEDQKEFIELNAELAREWPSITHRKPYADDADEWRGVPNKIKFLKNLGLSRSYSPPKRGLFLA